MDTKETTPDLHPEGKRLLTLKEAANILLMKDRRTIRDFRNKFLIPKKLIDPDTLSIDAFRLAEELHLTKLDGTENFISGREAEKILGIARNKLNHNFCEQYCIPYTVISMRNTGTPGVKLLFREKLLRQYLEKYELSVKEGTLFVEKIARNNVVDLLQTCFEPMVKMVGIKNKKALEAILLYTAGNGMQEIGDKLGGKTRERARQLVSEGKEDLSELLVRITSTNEKLLKSPYANMQIDEMVDRLTVAENTIKNLREEIDRGRKKGFNFSRKRNVGKDENPILSKPLKELHLSTRLNNCLGGNNINDLKTILEQKPTRLKKIRGFGKKLFTDLAKAVEPYGYIWKSEFGPAEPIN